MMEYKRGDAMTTLPCSHQYHEKCIKKWLENDKVFKTFKILFYFILKDD